MVTVSILNTGVANIASVYASLSRLGAKVTIISTADEILSAKAVVLPGVGAFGAGINALSENGFDAPLLERINIGLPTLAICLGMQLLCSSSEESNGVKGLGLIDVEIKKFMPPLRVPHFGWNKVVNEKSDESEYAYFANSFYLPEAPLGWTSYWSEYGQRFVSMIRKEKILATQFHPEISGEYGRKILMNWLREASC